jgi:predicted glycogen debranching enzyme
MLEFNSDDIRNFAEATSREWLETNGIGGFSSSTIIGLNTRRYHGLLTAATRPPVGRFVLLSKLEETLIIGGDRYELSANQYPGVVHPQGFAYQTGFQLNPFPVFTYEVNGVLLEKSLFMLQGENTVVIQYEIKSLSNDTPTAQPAALEIRPLIAFRDYHSTTHENDALNKTVQAEDYLLTFRPYTDLPALYLAHDAEIDHSGFWYQKFQYAAERERGLDSEEDLYSPCALRFDLTKRKKVSLIASTERRSVKEADVYRLSEIERRKQPKNISNLVTTLRGAADQFIVSRQSGNTVIAGYHWFGDWGRDTMIALPGLTLATGRADVAKCILGEFAKHIDRGMLPNRFPDNGETPEYNTVDAMLWFFEAVRSYVQYTSNYEFVRINLYPILKETVDWYVKGTRYQIHVDDDGLLYSGEPGVQLTWMDAKIGDWVVTPRSGKPVEIQALWYNSLCVMEQLAGKFKDTSAKKRYATMANKAQNSFNEIFWNDATGCLYDVVNGDSRDAAVRPNQVIAISLANSMISKDRARSILNVVERELLTPRGLRTLSPTDPNYVGRYQGGPRERDAVYHQGTVWPWLMGPYINAIAKTFGKTKGRRFATAWFQNFHTHLRDACLGQVSEIFDGDAPHLPRGCVAQAWSVSELLHAALKHAG